jgi:spore germination protein YaaH
VTKAVDNIDGDASRVWIRNVDLLDTLAKKLGRESFQNVMRGQGNISNEDASTVKSTLREVRIQMEQGGNKSTDRNDDA